MSSFFVRLLKDLLWNNSFRYVFNRPRRPCSRRVDGRSALGGKRLPGRRHGLERGTVRKPLARTQAPTAGAIPQTGSMAEFFSQGLVPARAAPGRCWSVSSFRFPSLGVACAWLAVVDLSGGSLISLKRVRTTTHATATIFAASGQLLALRSWSLVVRGPLGERRMVRVLLLLREAGGARALV